MDTPSIFRMSVIGICIGIALRTVFELSIFETLFVLVMAFACALFWRKSNTAAARSFFVAASVLQLSCALGMMRMEAAVLNEYASTLHAHVGQQMVLEGVIIAPPELREKNQHLIVETEDTKVLVLADRFARFAYGDAVTVEGTISLPEAFETDIGRVFDYRGYLRARGIEYSIAYAEVTVEAHARANPVFAHLYALKDSFMGQITQYLGPPHSGLGVGLLLGVKQALGDELELAFRKAGIMHIVVLSGYNIMLVIVFVMYVLSFFFPFRIRLLLGMLAIAAFAVLVGPTATVLRASLMASLLLLATLTGRTYAVIQALLATGLAMLLINPYLLVHDVGFQFSFIATLGLIVLSPVIERHARFMPEAFGLRGFLVTTIAAQVFVTPILLYQIGEFSLVAVLVNLLVLPMVPVAMLLTFAVGVLAYVAPALAAFVAFFAHQSLAYIIGVAQWFASLPFSTITIPPFPFVLVGVSYVLILVLLYRAAEVKDVQRSRAESEWVIVDERIYKEHLAGEQRSPAK